MVEPKFHFHIYHTYPLCEELIENVCNEEAEGDWTDCLSVTIRVDQSGC